MHTAEIGLVAHSVMSKMSSEKDFERISFDFNFHQQSQYQQQ